MKVLYSGKLLLAYTAFKCASYLDVIEADDASDDLPDFNWNDKNYIQIDNFFETSIQCKAVTRIHCI